MMPWIIAILMATAAFFLVLITFVVTPFQVFLVRESPIWATARA